MSGGDVEPPCESVSVERVGQGAREELRISSFTEDQAIKAQWGIGGGSMIAGG